VAGEEGLASLWVQSTGRLASRIGERAEVWLHNRDAGPKQGWPHVPGQLFKTIFMIPVACAEGVQLSAEIGRGLASSSAEPSRFLAPSRGHTGDKERLSHTAKAQFHLGRR